MLVVVVIRARASVSVRHIHQRHKVIVPVFQCTAGACSGRLCPAPLGRACLRIPKGTGPDTAEQGAQGRETGADHADMHFNGAPVAHFYVVPYLRSGGAERDRWDRGTQGTELTGKVLGVGEDDQRVKTDDAHQGDAIPLLLASLTLSAASTQG